MGRRGRRVPFGCTVLAQFPRKPELQFWSDKVYGQCFPSPAVEDFAQSSKSPWTTLRPGECQWLARAMVEGTVLHQMAAPHMEYNYRHYANYTIHQNPDQEVWAIRLEHAPMDLDNLQKSLGWTGDPPKPTEKVSHGSEVYLPSPLSTKAYQKLCCVLEKELQIYREFLWKAINLREQDRQTSMEELRSKCGISSSSSWNQWRSTCREQLDRDWMLLQQFSNQTWFSMTTANGGMHADP